MKNTILQKLLGQGEEMTFIKTHNRRVVGHMVDLIKAINNRFKNESELKEANEFRWVFSVDNMRKELGRLE
ncbi:hypothetical protein JOC86_004239 [Bacillus pakistanensis]|uniref:Uncharacterized protein n=1 Tax=Rossellomorea pakistanensis TaxID=992288 RepID=A0ABS2NIN9_9BACI|nr:hypothetical protein [Bacillus pakistanensis]MBM7587665.1 hypothetical protein [Bacillus pakistanensis]